MEYAFLTWHTYECRLHNKMPTVHSYLKIHPLVNDSSLLEDAQNASVRDEVGVTGIATPVASNIDKISIS